MAQGKLKNKSGGSLRKKSKRKNITSKRRSAPKKRGKAKNLGEKVRRSVTSNINKNIENIMKARVEAIYHSKAFKVVERVENIEEINVKSVPKTGQIKRKKAYGELSRVVKRAKREALSTNKK